MLVSVIMPIFNGIQFLRESIDSILNQTHEDLEFIIVDDGSTEPVMDLIRSCLDTRIIAFRNSKNIGLTKSLNLCLDRVRGNFVVRHDGDDISLPNRIEKQLKYFKKGIGFVGSWAQSINESGDFVTAFVDTHCRCSDEDLKTIYLKTICMADPTSIYSIEAVRKIGYFDEGLYKCQTYNYNRRIQSFFKGKVIPEVLYLRRLWPGQVGKRVTQYLRSKNMTINFKDLANQFAKARPVIRERQRHSWEPE